jgi:hypothetical protein
MPTPKPLQLILLAGALALATGCASSFRLAPRQGPGQELIWQDGRQAVVMADSHVAFSLQGEKAGSHLQLKLTVRNLTLPRVDVVPATLGVTCWRGGKPRALAVVDPEEHLARIQLTQAVGTTALALADAFVTSAGATRTVTRTIQPKEPGGTPQTVTETVHDPELAARQAERRERERRRIQAEFDARNAELKRSLLHATTLRPGELVSGQVLVAFEDGEGYQVRVPLGGRWYVVNFTPVRK